MINISIRRADAFDHPRAPAKIGRPRKPAHLSDTRAFLKGRQIAVSKGHKEIRRLCFLYLSRSLLEELAVWVALAKAAGFQAFVLKRAYGKPASTFSGAQNTNRFQMRAPLNGKEAAQMLRILT